MTNAFGQVGFKITRLLLAAAALLASAAGAQSQALSLRIQDGRATLDARGVSVRQILDEWAALTGAIVVGRGSVSDEPVTLHLVHVPERAALDILLRQTGGYILAENRVREGTATIGRIFIMPAGAIVRGPSVGPSLPTPPVAGQQSADLQLPGDPVMGMPQVGLDGPEQELVDISEGVRDQPTDAAKVAPVAPVSPFGATAISGRPGAVSPVPLSAPQ